MSRHFYRKITRSLIFLLSFLIIIAVSLSTYYYYLTKQYENRVYPNIIINGQSFEGKTKDDITAYFDPINKSLANKQIVITFEDKVATYSGDMLDLKYNADIIQTQALAIGRTPSFITNIVQRFQTLFNTTRYTFNYKPEYDMTTIQEYLTELDETYSVAPKDARFELNNGRVSVFKPEEKGQKLNVEEARDKIVAYLNTVTDTSTSSFNVGITSEPIDPEITLSNINELGIVEIIGVGRSDYSGSSSERVHNLQLASTKFHGVLIPPDGIFSYNDTVGDISQATGYKASYIIKDGRTIYGDGGGVCQDSTTLFRAALNSGLPIVERKAHSYRVSYYENDRKPGFDATVFAPTVDFKFKNDTGNYILIQSKIDEANNFLTFEFWGKKDGRVVELSDATVYDYRPAPEPLYQDDPTLARGVVKQVDWASPGARSSFTYKVTRNGEVLQDETFYSNYRPWQAVYLVGTRD